MASSWRQPKPPPLSPNQQRIRVMVVSFPLVVVTSIMLYRRIFLGEEQRKLKPGDKILPPPKSGL